MVKVWAISFFDPYEIYYYDFRNVAYTVIELDPITQKGGGG